ncbi:hypothetical protein F2P79_021578 [Pimephales promelas]|nr:hypothetical protein F2P79_021578 [Pimephales promelas]
MRLRSHDYSRGGASGSAEWAGRASVRGAGIQGAFSRIARRFRSRGETDAERGVTETALSRDSVLEFTR